MNENFIQKLTERFGVDITKEYEIRTEYTKVNEKVEFYHTVCNNTFLMTPNDFLNGHRCPICANKKRAKKSTITIESYKKKVKEIFGDEYQILSESITKLSDKIEIKHCSCGNVYTATARNLLRKMGCRNCSYKVTGEKQKGKKKPHPNVKTTDDFKQDVLDAIGADYEVIGDYINSYTHIKMRHKCGHEYDVLPHNIISHHTKCPICSISNVSEKEKELLDFIKSIYSGTIKNNSRITNDEKTFELDIYLPDKKIGIEFDGLYWHSDSKVEKNYHIEKTNFFEKLDIRVIHIFEDEWDFKKDIVKNKIKNILGLNTKKIYARDCIIREVSAVEKDAFLEINHIQGKDTCCIREGLFYQDELVAVMTFSKPRISLSGTKEKYEYELSRFATSVNITGGFSKLLKYCIKKYDISSIQTFADLRWSSKLNNVYIKNGFILDHISAPSYWYVPKNVGIREHRFKYRKSVLKKMKGFNEDKTEIENMKNFGYKIIYDCGNLVYKMIIKKEIS